MSTVEETLGRSLTGAHKANEMANQAMAEFGYLVAEGKWDLAEAARLRAISHLEAYFDHLSAAYKRLHDL